MSRKAFLHVNGVDYELARVIDGDEFGDDFQALERLAEGLALGAGGEQFSERVVLNGASARIHFTTQGVFAAGAFLEEEPAPGHVYKIH